MYSNEQAKPKKKTVIILLWIINGLILIFIGLYFVGLNSLTVPQEKLVREEARKLLLEEKLFLEEEAQTNYVNKPISELEKLAIKLGIEVSNSSQPPSKNSKEAYQAFSDIYRKYLDSQLEKSNDDIDPPPDSIQKYFTSQSQTLESVYDYIFSNDPISWNGSDSFSYQLSNLLLMDALESARQEKSQRMLNALEAYWKFERSLEDSSFYIAPVFNRNEMGVLRKISYLPKNWENYIKNNNYWMYYSKLSPFWKFRYRRLSIPSRWTRFSAYSSRPEQWLNIFLQPYLKLININAWRVETQTLPKVSQQDICSLPEITLKQKFTTESFWVNNFSFSQEQEAEQIYYFYKGLIDLELTHKILKLKQILASNGELSSSTISLEGSTVCQNIRWSYKASKDGRLLIAIREGPAWLRKVKKYGLSLNHSINLPNKIQH